MRKEWLIGIGLASLILAGCSTDETQQNTAPAQPVWNGPVKEIPGVQPKYESLIPSANQDYSVSGKRYRIVTDTSRFSQVGLASFYGQESAGNTTASGEKFDPNAYTAAHPTLPIPSYVRVTNLANGRQLVVRINDRGPFVPGRIIDLSAAAANRLNISDNTQVRVDAITVAPDGTLSGPGTVGTKVAIQSYDLPARPDLGGPAGMTSPAAETSDVSADTTSTALPATSGNNSSNVMPIANSTLQNGSNNLGAPVQSSGLLGAPQPLAAGVLESDTPAASTAPAQTQTQTQTQTQDDAPAAATVSAPAAPRQTEKAPVAATAHSSGYVVQVAAVNNAQRAKELQQKLSHQFGVAGHVEAVDGNIYRVQLGGYSNRHDAVTLQQRLAGEKITSFITTAK